MRISFILTMASAIFLTAFLIYLHTYICYGQQNNFFNHQNFKKQHGLPSVPTTSNNPNPFFSKNLTQDENNGKVFTSNLGNFQPSLNSQNIINQSEQQCNLQQHSSLQPMALPQINIQPQLQQPPVSQTCNRQPSAPVAISYNAQIPPSEQPPLDLPQQMNFQTYIPQPPIIRPVQTQQQPTPVPLPVQYSLQSPVATSVPGPIASIMPPFSVASSYLQNNPPQTIGVPSCMTPINVPVTIMETPQNNMYSPIPSHINTVISKPAYSSYYPSFNPNHSVMIGYNQNDALIHREPMSPSHFSLVQASTPQYNMAPSYPMNTVFTPDYNQGSQSSSLKTLLPIILNLLKEKNQCNCPCRSCKCEGKKKRADNTHVTSSYSKQKKYPLSDDGPEIEALSEELETIRNVREPKKAGKLKNTIPDDSEEIHNESLEYNDSGEHEEE